MISGLTSFLSLSLSPQTTSTTQPDATITQPYESAGFWEYADKTGTSSQPACLLHILAVVRNEEEVDECTLVNSWK